jgi:hypothetical protein
MTNKSQLPKPVRRGNGRFFGAETIEAATKAIADGVIDVAGMAEHLGTSPGTVRKWVRAEGAPKPRRKKRSSKKKRRHQQRDELVETSPETSPETPPETEQTPVADPLLRTMIERYRKAYEDIASYIRGCGIDPDQVTRNPMLRP